MEFPSLWLRGLGVLLIIIGLIGSAVGFYAIKLVSDYVGEAGPEALEMQVGLTDLSQTLRNRKTEFESSIDEASDSLNDASTSIDNSGINIRSASTAVDIASRNLKAASTELRISGELDAEASAYLQGASEVLRLWANSYEFNGSQLPNKALFERAVENMSMASNKLGESGARTEAVAYNISETATSLEAIAVELREASDGLVSAGKDLGKSGGSLSKLKRPIGGLMWDIIVPLDSSARNTKLLRDVAVNAKNWAYLVLGYLIVMHLIFVGIGISLLIIDVNLFYPS
jgi:hypothetical protein